MNRGKWPAVASRLRIRFGMPLEPRELTWTGLLGRWIEFAQASIALPDDAAGRGWRASVPHIINLQAVTFALGEADQLDRSERSLACDKAAILIDGASRELGFVWGETLPASIAEMIEDAHAMLSVVRAA
ncbi:MAG: hypothetical protein ACR2GY_07235 [Phycisphaerales bacterium]